MGKKKKFTPPSFATSNGRHYIPLYDDQLNSPAFMSLSAVAVRVYLILRQEYKGDYSGNKIICPYNTMVSKGVSKNSISGAIDQLEALGFIRCERGGLAHEPTVYRFIDDWKHVDTKSDAKAILEDLRERKKDLEHRKSTARDNVIEFRLGAV